jgi:hypothetical protein
LVLYVLPSQMRRINPSIYSAKKRSRWVLLLNRILLLNKLLDFETSTFMVRKLILSVKSSEDFTLASSESDMNGNVLYAFDADLRE